MRKAGWKILWVLKRIVFMIACNFDHKNNRHLNSNSPKFRHPTLSQKRLRQSVIVIAFTFQPVSN